MFAEIEQNFNLSFHNELFYPEVTKVTLMIINFELFLAHCFQPGLIFDRLSEKIKTLEGQNCQFRKILIYCTVLVEIVAQLNWTE